MLKAKLRKQALKQRNGLSGAELSLLNQKLLEHFKTLDFSDISSIHIFLPIIKNNEPDTFLLIDWLQQHHPKIEIVVPKANFENSILNHFTFLNKEDLIENHYHIPEPQKAKPFKGELSMVIIPLLAFDLAGYRVGYGKGFYDRFLQHSKAKKIGLSFFDAVSKINDVHLNDIKLDQCITPNGIVEF